MYHACVSRLESVHVASGVRVSVIGEGEDTRVGHKSSVEVRSMVVEDLETLGQSVNRPKKKSCRSELNGDSLTIH
jgi:hypothetical protein